MYFQLNCTGTLDAYIFDRATRCDAVIEAHPLLLIWILPWAQDVLVSDIVWPFVQHPAATHHPDGVTAAEVGVQVWAVAAALIALTLEVPVLKEYNL